MGDKSKLTDRFLEAAKKVIHKGTNAIIYTDEELVTAINQELEEEERISYRTFKRWKAGELKDPNLENLVPLIKDALVIQKGFLFDKLQKDKDSWTRWAWIIERKFSEWNIKHQHDLTSNGNELKQITGFKID